MTNSMEGNAAKKGMSLFGEDEGNGSNNAESSLNESIETGGNYKAIDFSALDWEAQGLMNGVFLDYCEIPGEYIKAFRAKSFYSATVDKVVGAITNMERFTEWVEGAYKAAQFERLSDSSQACYYINDAPWPLVIGKR